MGGMVVSLSGKHITVQSKTINKNANSCNTFQEWLKQERYYEFYERQQMNRRRRKKIPITQRLN